MKHFSKNPPVVPERTIEVNLQVPVTVSDSVYQASGNCHSDQAKWPWDARIAPFFWVVARDVNSVRGVMKLSD